MKVPSKSNAGKACPKTSSAQKDLNKHLVWNLRSKHMQRSYVKVDRVEIWKCEYCTRGFLDQYTYNQHQEKHSQDNHSTSEDHNNKLEKPYTCYECGWKFVQKSTLDDHSFLHKPFANVCECGIGYYKKCDLDAHKRLVHPKAKSTNSAINKVKGKVNSLYNMALTKSEKVYEDDVNQTEAENEHDSKENNFKPRNSDLKPKLKATLIFKLPNKKNHNGNIKKEHKEKFLCPICNKIYSKKSNLDAHMTTHEEVQQKYDLVHKNLPNETQLLTDKKSLKINNQFACNVCKKKLSSKMAVDIHMRRHTGEKPYPCHICKKSFTQSGVLKLHLLRHTGVKDFKCDICEKDFLTFGALNLHRRTHTGEKPYECKVCGKRFADPSAFKRHKILHTGLKPYRCKHCPKAFADPSALAAHERRHYGWTICCPTCPKSFKGRLAWLSHMKTVHTVVKDEDKFECDHCHKNFILKQHLVGHMQRMHLNRASANNCDICGKKFRDKFYLKRHMKDVHEKNWRFKCDDCGNQYYWKHSLERHKIVHQEIKSFEYECNDCLAIFSQKQLLSKHIQQKHLRIHCKECKKVFSTTRLLKRHKAKGCHRCFICHKAFPTRLRLTDHYNIHHARKSELQLYDCDKCFKQYKCYTSLRRHKQSCHNETLLSFICDYCKQAFTKRKHLITHIGDKHMVSLYCDVCLKRFLSDAALKQHKADSCKTKQISCDICEKVVSLNMLKGHLAVHLPSKYECDKCGRKFRYRSVLVRHMKLMRH